MSKKWMAFFMIFSLSLSYIPHKTQDNFADEMYSGFSSHTTETASIYKVPDNVFVLDDGECYTLDFDLYCRGSNSLNRLGLGISNTGIIGEWSKVELDIDQEIISMDQNLYATCALTSSGDIWCWGSNAYGQISGTGTSTTVPTKVNFSGSFDDVTVGGYTSCGINSGQLYCWGHDYFRLITNSGNGSRYYSPKLVPAASNNDVKDVQSSFYHTCIIDDIDDVYCRGNYFGQGASQNWTKLNLTKKSNIDTDVRFIHGETGYYDNCFASSQMKLWCVGYSGKSWKNSTGSGLSNVEHNLSGIQSFTFSGSNERICATLSNQSIYCRGSTSEIVSSNPTSSEFSFFEKPEYGSTNSYTGKNRMCTVSIENTLGCYEDDSHSLELKIDEIFEAEIVNGVLILDNSTIANEYKNISSATIESNRVTYDRLNVSLLLLAHENNSLGFELTNLSGSGLNVNVDVNIIPTFSDAELIVQRSTFSQTFGDYIACEIEKHTNKLFCSAYASSYLGAGKYYGEDNDRYLDGLGQHRQILQNRTFSGVSSDTSIGGLCAVASDGEVLCYSAYSTSYDYITPYNNEWYSPFYGSNASSVVMGGNDKGNYCAVLINGSVACKGKSTPFEGSTRWSTKYVNSNNGNITKISIVDHACHLTDTGVVECWGYNNLGRLGIGESTSYSTSTPEKISGQSRVYKDISVSEYHACALSESNNLYCWGGNQNGQLGLGTTTQSYNTPQAVISNGTVQSFATSEANTCYMNFEGDIYCWGHASFFDRNFDETSPVLEMSIGASAVQDCELNRVSSDEWLIGLNCGGVFRYLGYLSQYHGTHSSDDYSGLISTPKEQIEGQTQISGYLFLKNGTHLLESVNLSVANFSNNGIFQIPINGSSIQKNLTWTFSSSHQLSVAVNGLFFNYDFEFEVVPDTDYDLIPNLYDGDDDNDLIPDTLDSCPVEVGNSSQDRRGCPDNDGDGTSNVGDPFPTDKTQWSDFDGDGFGDNSTGNRPDSCPQTFGESDKNGTFGCQDSDRDGWADTDDEFNNESSQWKDSDGDGYGDEFGGFQGDACKFITGNSTIDRFGCLDSDGDGYSDLIDAFDNNPTQYLDSDGDGYGNNQSANATQVDAFPSDGTQWNDTDGDGHGDNKYGSQGDHFPNNPNRWQDSDEDGIANPDDAFDNDATQWNDTDGDGYGDNSSGSNADLFPNDSSEWYDSDEDGTGDNSDDFIYDGSQQTDSDGDGYGDDPNGTNGDQYANDSLRWSDRDGDGYSDQESDDAFPLDPTQWTDSDGDGYGDNANGNNPDAFTNDSTEWRDTDGDGYGDNGDWAPSDGTQWVDGDSDGYGDNPNGTNGDEFTSDSLRWSDRDADGYSDQQGDDAFPLDPSQWADQDGDGYGDNPNGTRPDAFVSDNTEWSDLDGDGVGDNGDVFPFDGSQWEDRDGDGYGDNANGSNADAFPDNPDRWRDSDNDGVADEDDAFVNDPSQNSDSDGDRFGDNPNGSNPDAFPEDANEWRDGDGDGYGDNSDRFPVDATQWNDTDGDGYGDNKYGNQGDHFPNDPNRWQDSDEDGIADPDDAFPEDATQYADADSDGYGDNISGNNADAFPDDPTEWDDSDKDGVGDNSDTFSFNPTQTQDSDGDGYGDNQSGNNPDAFPNDETQFSDSDGDGYGDNPNGNNPDAFPSDNTQWSDRDGDGYGDNPNGRNPDLFPDNPSQFEDADGDGLGDNQSGTESDPFLFDTDNDGYANDVDVLPLLASPGDLDNDGVADDDDAFPGDFRESKDSDGDGEGDNADVDDDNDGWTDIDEIREGADPLSSSNQPVEGFEILIPGSQVSLGAWDIIGVMTGVPLALWVSAGLLTRTRRAKGYEDRLQSATSKEELFNIAGAYEYSLMWRMIGPHQALRLERMRTEIEREKFQFIDKVIPDIEEVKISRIESIKPVGEKRDVESTSHQKETNKVEVNGFKNQPSRETVAQNTDAEGYEWWKSEDGVNWYRIAGTNEEWLEFKK